MGSTAEFRQAFVSRLKDACDSSTVVPPPNKGRQQHIAEQLGVAPEAVSKWFKGVSMPKPEKLIKLAELLQVEQTWLSYGVSPEMDRKERKAHSREVDGAVHLVMGLTMLTGGHCGIPSDQDARASFVDFYATVKGSVYSIHVCLGREIEKDKYELVIPKEFEEVVCIGVIPVAKGKYQLLELPRYTVSDHKQRKAGGYSITIERVDTRFMTGDSTWPKIRFFGERT
jgi:transcriptional regulator with XRE-family HTH domain